MPHQFRSHNYLRNLPHSVRERGGQGGPEFDESLFNVNLHLSLLHVPDVDRVHPGASETVGELAVESSNPIISDWTPLVTSL